MYKIVVLLLISVLLNAKTPKPYASLGNPLYNNLHKIITLRDMQVYKLYVEDIDKYIKDVKKVKKLGYKLEYHKSKKKKKYLRELRRLSKINQYFLESIHNYYMVSMQKKDFNLFRKIVSSGLIDLVKHKKEIYTYCLRHKKYMKLDKTLENIIKSESKKKITRAKLKKHNSKKSKEQEKIRRIREHSKRAEIKLEKQLQEEVDKKKEAIRKEQREELSR